MDNINKLSKDQQQALRTTMETHVSAFRLILCCENQNDVIKPIQSRCMSIRVPSPSEQEMRFVLQNYSDLKKLSFTEEIFSKVTSLHNRNITRALFLLQTYHHDPKLEIKTNQSFASQMVVNLSTDLSNKGYFNSWTCLSNEIFRFLNFRNNLNNFLFVEDPHIIMQLLCQEFLKINKKGFVGEMIHLAAKYVIIFFNVSF